MSGFRTFKMQGIVLAKETAQDSYRIIQEALTQVSTYGIPGDIRVNSPERKTGESVQDYILSLLAKEPGEFAVTGVELINGNQLEFDVRWQIDISDEAINQLYIVPVYLSDNDTRKLIAFHARL